MCEKRKREANCELTVAGASLAKQRQIDELSDLALAEVARPASQRPASQNTNEHDGAALLDAERALGGSKGTRTDGRGLMFEFGPGVGSEAATTAAPTPTSASTVDLTDDSASACCNGASASAATKEEAPANATGPTTVRFWNVISRFLSAERAR